jgi:hypothetical protein
MVGEWDHFFLAMLRSLGIAKGRLFTPNEPQKKPLDDAVLLGEYLAQAKDGDWLDGGNRTTCVWQPIR